MRSIHESLELGALDALAELDPSFLDAVAGGSGGQECCQRPYLCTHSDGQGNLTYHMDCSGYAGC